MSPPLVLTFLSLSLSIVCNGELDKEVCEIPTETCGPFIPPLPVSYVAKMEVTYPDARTTKYAVEYYDGENLRGAITWRFQGEETRILYDASARTLITVIGWTPNDPYETSAQCFVSSFTFNRDNFIIGVEKDNNNSITHTALIGGLLRYNPDLRFKYFNETQSYVRGIKADKWSACLYLPEVDGTFEILFYWSDLKSQTPTPSGEQSVPLKTEIRGRFRPVAEEEVYKNISIVTNFIWFQSNPPMDDELFQPPHGVFCINDDKTKPFPPFPETFSVSTENIVQIDGSDQVIITNQKLWYNLPAKLQRVDEYGPNTDRATIFDYKTGVNYLIDEYSAQCLITEPSSSEFIKYDELFWLNVDRLEYLGKYVIRDRLCDTWSGKVNNLMIEWSFLDDTWHQSEKDGVLTSTPVQTVLINHKTTGSEKTTINYFHFHPIDDEFPFEIDYCFGPDKRKIFQISFEFTSNVASFDFNSFARKCRVVLAREIQVSLLRISQIQAESREGKIFVQFMLLNKTTESTENNVAMEDAVTNLRNVIRSNGIVIHAGSLANTQEPLYLTALPDSLLELDILDPCSPTPNTTTSAKRVRRSAPEATPQPANTFDLWSTGQLVGLGMGLFAIGTILGVIFMMIILLRSQVAINTRREDDDGIQLSVTTSTQE